MSGTAGVIARWLVVCLIAACLIAVACSRPADQVEVVRAPRPSSFAGPDGVTVIRRS